MREQPLTITKIFFWKMLTMAEFNWWKVCTFLSQQIKMLLVVLREILLFGWGCELSLLFQWWGQSNMVMVKAVFKVTCLHFELSGLGLIYLFYFFLTSYFKQEERIST